MRAFLAIEMPAEVADALCRVQALLPAGRRVPAENLHLTLAFLDEQPVHRLEALDAELQTLRAAPCMVAFDGLGQFTAARQGLIHAAVRAGPDLLALHGALGRAVRRAGIRPDRTRFHPHVTLLRGVAPGAALPGPDALPPLPGFCAGEVTLMRSQLHRQGARYAVLARYPLAGSPLG